MTSKMRQVLIAAFFVVAVNTQSFPCPIGFTRDWANRCVPDSSPCPPGQKQDRINGKCVNINPGPQSSCPLGQFRDPVTGQCSGPVVGCLPGQRRINGECVNVGLGPEQVCQFRDPVTGQCLNPDVFCPPGQTRDPFSGQCVLNYQPCPPGMIWDLFTGQCSSLQNWLCSICNECCYNRNAYQQVYQCYFDYQGSFEGCLQNSGIAPNTINGLMSIRSNPKFATALRSLRG